MLLLAVYIALAIGVSFLCSIMEAVLLSVTPGYIGALRERRPRAAARLEALKGDIDRPLAAILSLNTVAHTVGAAGAGAQATVVFGSAALGIFSALLTLGILVLSEIVPKTIGALYWRALAEPVALLLVALIPALYPLVWLSRWITRLVSRGRMSGPQLSREELAAMADIGAQLGVIDRDETRVVKSLMRFRELTARDVMTPRTVLLAIDETTSVAEVARGDPSFSRIPVYRDEPDSVTGYVLKDDLLQAHVEGREASSVSTLRREILRVSESEPLPDVFEQLVSRREHIALVHASHGRAQGVVTMEDLIEALLDIEIMDEGDRTHDLRELARQRWRRRAARLGLPLDSSDRT